MIRSKGVGVYFVTQNPRDVPDDVLGQLGNRVQHALRAFTPADQKAVKSAAQTFRPNPKLDTERVLTELAVGEALISTLDEKGQPGIVERALVIPPRSQVGAITPEQRKQIINSSLVSGQYEQAVDRESAYERLKAAAAAAAPPPVPAPASSTPRQTASQPGTAPSIFDGLFGSGGRRTDSLATAMAKSAARAIGSNMGRQIVRGIMGSIFSGGSSRRR